MFVTGIILLDILYILAYHVHSVNYCTLKRLVSAWNSAVYLYLAQVYHKEIINAMEKKRRRNNVAENFAEINTRTTRVHDVPKYFT